MSVGRHPVACARAARGLGAGVALAAVVPLMSFVHHPDIAWGLKAALCVVVGLAAAEPLLGVAALSVLFPVTIAISTFLDWVPPPEALTDAFVLAFVAGAWWRVAVPARGRPGRLDRVALAFGAAVAASAIVELHALHVIAPQRALLLDIWRHLTTDYWRQPRDFPVLHDVVRWTAGLLMAVAAERAIRARPAHAPAVVRFWLIGGFAGALLTAVQLVEVLMSRGLPFGATLGLAERSLRLTTLQPDVNAAGSYFALFLLPALVVGWRRRDGWMLACAVPLLALAFVAARSRAAMAAVLAVLTVRWALRLPRSPFTVRLAGGAAVGVVALAFVTLALTSRAHVSLGEAARLRDEMTTVAFRTIERHPVFGVGLGDYIRWSRRFITPDLPVLSGFAPNGENAHDNLLQITAEVGIPGGLIFLWLMGLAVGPMWVASRSPASPDYDGMAAGITAFLISAIFGNPLLVPQVFAVFALALGITAGVAPESASTSDLPRRLALGAAAFYAASLVWRLA